MPEKYFEEHEKLEPFHLVLSESVPLKDSISAGDSKKGRESCDKTSPLPYHPQANFMSKNQTAYFALNLKFGNSKRLLCERGLRS